MLLLLLLLPSDVCFSVLQRVPFIAHSLSTLSLSPSRTRLNRGILCLRSERWLKPASSLAGLYGGRDSVQVGYFIDAVTWTLEERLRLRALGTTVFRALPALARTEASTDSKRRQRSLTSGESDGLCEVQQFPRARKWLARRSFRDPLSAQLALVRSDGAESLIKALRESGRSWAWGMYVELVSPSHRSRLRFYQHIPHASRVLS